jgi:hypothetical protein
MENLREAVSDADASRDRSGVAAALDPLVAGLAEAGRYEQAARLAGAAEALHDELGATPVGQAREHGLAIAEEALGTVRLAELREEGRHLSYEEVVALAAEE